jgi:hypothetical protein
MRLVLMAFEDDKMAEGFIQAVKDDNVLFATPVKQGEGESIFEEVKWDNLEKVTVEAMWQAPTKFCECDDYAGVSHPTKNYRWRVHAKCAKPRPQTQQSPRNLLEPKETHPRDSRYWLYFMPKRDIGAGEGYVPERKS